ncbi:MAG: HAMP domain-containing histidine kinase [Bacteroidales bacterium]|nr:HAMP domain-containing histidine kinase [Bacteroidales bacterium]
MRLKNLLRRVFELFEIKHGGYLVDPKEASNFEAGLLIPFSLVSIIFSAVSTIINFIWDFSEDARVLVVVAIGFYIIIYILAKSGKNINFTRWLFITVTLVFANFSWYYDYRSAGPMIYLLFIFYGYLIFMLDNKKLIIVSIIIVINIGVLYFLELGSMLPPSNYPNAEMRRIDAYTATMLYIMAAFVLMRIAKKNYVKEYHKAMESDKLKTAFLANMSHEIRTPLNAVIGFSNLMLTENVTQEERKFYKSLIDENNKFLLGLVNNILDISLIESNTLHLVDEPCNLNKLISEQEKFYSKILQKQGNERVKLIKDIPDDNFNMDIDCGYLERALRQLIDNAIKFTERGTVELGFFQEGKSVRFFVKDTGIGIKEKEIRLLFERFNKLEYSNQKVYEGTGIGLYLVKLIVDMFGGTVSVESKYGVGSNFSFAVPAKKLRITLAETPSEKA